MSNWLGRLLGIGRKVPQQIQKKEPVQKIVQKVETTFEPKVKQVIHSNLESLGSKLSYGKWYYGVDRNAQPIIKKKLWGIEKRYPCKDGGEVVVSYISNADKSSHLDITKVGNQKDIYKGDWYRGVYADTVVKHYIDSFGDKITQTIKKKGARKQVLSSVNGKPTDEVHVPLKRWQLIENIFGRKKENSNIISSNPRDFDRFCD